MPDQVWAVHVTLDGVTNPCDNQSINHIASSQKKADREAYLQSTNPGVTAAAVTRFVVDHLGEHERVSLYVKGERQDLPHRTNGNQYISG